MLGTQILDVAIGLIFIFLLLSLVVTAFNELVAAWLKRRSKNLRSGIVRLLGDEKLAQSVYDHPLITSLSQSSTRMPSYIPSRTFVLAVLDGLTKVGSPPPANAQDVEAALAKLPPEQQGLATALTVLLHDAGGNMDEFKKGLEQWFDNSMERVSGWYKRQTQWILLAMAVGVTIWANADAIALANTLYRDPTVRSALAAQAENYAKQQAAQDQPASTAHVDGPPPPPADPPSAEEEFDAASTKFDASVGAIRGLTIPLGWKAPTNTDSNDKRDPLPWSPTAIELTVIRHGLGWLLTALAISLGAPFWFDMLNKVVSIRAAGKAPEEKQKPPKQVPTPTEPGGKPAQS